MHLNMVQTPAIAVKSRLDCTKAFMVVCRNINCLIRARQTGIPIFEILKIYCIIRGAWFVPFSIGQMEKFIHNIIGDSANVIKKRSPNLKNVILSIFNLFAVCVLA